MATPSDLKTAFLKLASYCAYQERSLQEVREKLSQYQFSEEEEEAIISSLREENFLNEQRFAETFAQSKFRQKQWGKRKIAYGLKQKGVDSQTLEQALASIDAEDYWATLTDLAEKKLAQLKPDLSLWDKKKKVSNYLLQKGFEGGLVREVLEEVAN